MSEIQKMTLFGNDEEKNASLGKSKKNYKDNCYKKSRK